MIGYNPSYLKKHKCYETIFFFFGNGIALNGL